MTITDPLAYLTAKGHGLFDVAEDILATAGLNEDDIAGLLPDITPSTLHPPPIVTPTYDHNWPSVGVTESFFDRALAAAASGEPSNAQIEYSDETGRETASGGLDEWTGGDVMEEVEEVEDAWDLTPEEEEVEETNEDDAVVEDVGGAIIPGLREAELWVRNSPLAADHVAAGSFESAMSLLKNQVGAVHFEPLKPLFLSLYRSSTLYLAGAPSLPDLEIPLRRNRDHAEPRSLLPAAAITLQSITSIQLRAAYSEFQKAHFPEAAALFRSILHSLLFVITSTPAEATEVSTPLHPIRDCRC
jgi:coatomer protein complex subunit alpha (xenin)